MARKRKRKRKRLAPGLGGLRSRRSRLPGRRTRDPRDVVEVPVDYGTDVERLDDAVLALGDRVDMMVGR